MRVNLKRRVICYIIDLIIVFILGIIISFIIPKSNNYIEIQNEITNLSNNYLNSEVSFGEYFSTFSKLSKELDLSNILYLSILFIINILYFIIVPLLLKGRTIGMLICKLKLTVKDNSNLLFSILIRSVVAYGILYYLVQLGIMYFVFDNIYLIILTILSFIQILVVICSAFMIKYRDDKRSLADILSFSNILIES